MTQQVSKASAETHKASWRLGGKLYGQTAKARNRGPGAALVTFYGSTQEKAPRKATSK